MTSPLPWVVLLACTATHALPAVLPVPAGIALGAKLAIVLVAVLCWRTVGARRPRAMLLLGAVCAVAYTFLDAGGQLSRRLPSAQHGMSVRVLAQVAGVPAQRGEHCHLRLHTLEVNGRPQRLRLQARWRGEQACAPLIPGSRWRLVARLTLPRAAMNPGAGDRERWWFRHRVDARAWVREEFAVEAVAASGWRAPISRWRSAMRESIVRELPSQLEGARALLVALVLGLDRPLPAPMREVLTATGTAHLFAISGLHIGLLAAVVSALGRVWGWRASSARASPWPSLWALFAATVYALLAGFTVPTQRALCALAVWVTARLSAREVTPARVLGTALLMVLVWDPMAPLDAGFWLSFLAVVTLLVARPPPSTSASARWWWPQCLLAVALAPLAFALFGQLSWISPLANAVLIPIFSVVIVPISLLGVMLLPLAPELATPLLSFSAVALAAVFALLELVAGSAVGSGEEGLMIPLWALALCQIGVLALLVRGWPGRPWSAGLCVPMLLAVLVPGQDHPQVGSVRATVLDVGQGLAVVVETAEHVLLYDAGPSYYGTGTSAGERVVVPFLRWRNAAPLDRVVISHGDDDHAGGLGAVLAYDRAAPVCQGGGGATWPPCQAGASWTWDGVHFAVLHPPSVSEPWVGNEGSCVLRVTVGSGSAQRRLLLTGDIQVLAENHLLRTSARALNADVVVAPHHGSATSSGANFVDAVGAKVVVFAVGYANRWGFPHPAVQARWEGAGARVANSSIDGALTMVLRPNEDVVLRRERRARRRYWTLP